MEIKNCAHCGDQAYLQEFVDEQLQGNPFRVLCRCGMTTCNYSLKEDAVDVWNTRHELNPSEADLWLKEATEQRDRADKAETEKEDLSEALSQARRMLDYAGKLQ